MKTKILALAAILFASATTAAFAANDSKSDKDACKEQCSKKDRQKGCFGFNPFEGLNLTAEQQAKLDELKTQAKCNAEKKDCDKTQMRKQRKSQCISKVKEILTPEQYVTFLENIVINGQNPAKDKSHKKMDAGKHNGGQRVKGQMPKEPRK